MSDGRPLLQRLDAGAWPQAANMQEAAAHIRQQRDLLEECERALVLAMDWMHTDWDEHDETCLKVESTLAKLRKEPGR